MSFRVRLTLVAAAAVALAVVLASAVVWLVVRNQLYRELDRGLRSGGAALAHAPLHPEQAPDGNLYLDGVPGTARRFDRTARRRRFPSTTGRERRLTERAARTSATRRSRTRGCGC